MRASKMYANVSYAWFLGWTPDGSRSRTWRSPVATAPSHAAADVVDWGVELGQTLIGEGFSPAEPPVSRGASLPEL